MAKPTQQDAPEIAPGTLVDGRYRVIQPIGQGGNGMVYEVEHARTGRRLALKALLDGTGYARLEQEARAASLMKNGHTARIIDMEPSGPTGAYMVMELLEGQSLRALLDEAGQLPLELTVNMAMQVCECLHEAHALGVIHRDLKPENLFLCESPWPGNYDVKVLDFGVMKIADDGGAIPKSSLTRTGSTVGTPYYMSLEQLRNSSAVDSRADVYSLGVVLYECLSGRKPFQAETIGDLVYALCSGPPTALARLRPDLPPEVCEVVMRTLSANRDDRPPTMLELALRLLPHATPAFALWVRVDGKRPALAPRASMTTEADLYPGAPPPPAPRRRDTPTEMFVNGVHGAPPTDEESTAGDRDTPTRAYEASAIAPQGPLVSTMKSPGSILSEDSGTDTLDFEGVRTQPRPPLPGSGTPTATIKFGAPPPGPGDPGLQAPVGALLTVPLSAALGSHPLGPAPLGNVLRSLPTAPPPAPPPVPRPPPPPKPAWQASLDRALITVGRLGETYARRYRTAPPNTQIIVLIVAGTAVILTMGLFAFLLMR